MGEEEAGLLTVIEGAQPSPVTDEDLDTSRGKQDLKLRPCLFWVVVSLMGLEVAAMFVLVFFQGFGQGMRFHLDQWVLASIEAGVLIQTFALAKVITKALFKEL